MAAWNKCCIALGAVAYFAGLSVAAASRAGHLTMWLLLLLLRALTQAHITIASHVLLDIWLVLLMA